MLQSSEFRFIREVLELSGAEVYLVGGAVRDFFLNRETKDYDFIIRGVDASRVNLLLESLGKVDLVGKTFGVYKFSPENTSHFESFDIALPRTEHSLSMAGGYKDFDVQSDPKLPIENDLLRRDFTVNAIALKIETQNATLIVGDVIDPSGGLQDLEKKILRAVGDPEQRFQEDYLRILRGLRFACQLQFDIEAATKAAMQKLAGNLNNQKDATGESSWIVPRETIGREVVKMFVADPVKAFHFFEQGLFEILMPEMLKGVGCPQPPNWHTEGDVFDHARLSMKVLREKEFMKEFPKLTHDAEVVFGTLFHDIGKPYTVQTPEKDGTDRIRFSNHDIEGAKIAKNIVERLKLSVFPKESPLHVDAENIEWIVEKHLSPVKEKVDQMKKTTFEKYFFSERYPSMKLLAVSLADELSTIHDTGFPDTSNYYHVKGKMEEILKLSKGRIKPPKPVVSGDDIMKAFHLAPGPFVGELLSRVREEQLNGKLKNRDQALEYLKEFVNK